MSPIAPALDLLAAELAELTANNGRRVDARSLGILDREGQLPLGPPGRSSPNGACRLFRAADGWMAVNLARAEDHDLLLAWLGCDADDAPWDAIARYAPRRTCAALVEGAALLGLPAGAVGEVVRDSLKAPRLRLGEGRGGRSGLRVVDLSALWAGPMCGAVLAAMGALVTRIESPRRPDPTRTSTPEFFRRLNGAKRELSLDLTGASGRAQLHEAVGAADILITSARPRAFAGLGLDPGAVFAANPGLVWVAVTAYGWRGAAAARVGFGDDAAAAGGLVGWTADGAPRFLGDALADPVTGLAATVGALRAVEAGGGFLVDVSLAGSAAGAAAVCGLRRAT